MRTACILLALLITAVASVAADAPPPASQPATQPATQPPRLSPNVNIFASNWTSVIFPLTPSDFVALHVGSGGRPGGFDYGLADLRNNRDAGHLQPANPIADAALSPAGTYLAGARFDGDQGDRVIEVYSFKTGKLVCRIDTPSIAFRSIVGFCDDRTLVTSYGEPGANKPHRLELLDAESGKPIRSIDGVSVSTSDRFVLTPDGRFLATLDKRELCIYDLLDAKVVATSPAGSDWMIPLGLAASPDGKELATLHNSLMQDRTDSIGIWDLSGKSLSNMAIDPGSAMRTYGELRLQAPNENIQYLADGSGWLVLGRSIVDRSGKVVHEVPMDAVRPIDRDNLLVAIPRSWTSRASDVSLRPYKLPRKELDKAVSMVRMGGDLTDVDLPQVSTFRPIAGPPLTAMPAEPRGLAADPAATASKPLISKPIQLPTLPQGIDCSVGSMLFSSADSAKMLIACEERLTDRQRIDRTRLERYDLLTGQLSGTLTIPGGAEALDLSPDGTQVLVCSRRFADNRFDVWTIAPKPAHVIGWRQPQPNRGSWVKVWGAFVDAGHVLTFQSEQISLVRLSDCSEVYRLPVKSDSGPWFRPALSPGRKYLAFGTRQAVLFFDALTGQPLSALKTDIENAMPPCFHPDGRSVAIFSGPTGSRLVTIFDTTTAKQTSRFLLEWPFVSYGRVDWLKDGMAMVCDTALAGVDQQRQLWNYKNNGLLPRYRNMAPDRRYWHYNRQENGREHCVVPVPLPDEPGKTGLTVKPEDVYIVQPGQTISISVSVPGPAEGAAEITRILTEKLTAAGFKIAEGQKICAVVVGTTLQSGQPITIDGGNYPRSDVEGRISWEVDGKRVWTTAMLVRSDTSAMGVVRKQFPERPSWGEVAAGWIQQQWVEVQRQLTFNVNGIPEHVINPAVLGTTPMPGPYAPRIIPTQTTAGAPGAPAAPGSPPDVAPPPKPRTVPRMTPEQQRNELKALEKLQVSLAAIRKSADDLVTGVDQRTLSRDIFTQTNTRLSTLGSNLPAKPADLNDETAESLKALKAAVAEITDLYRSSLRPSPPEPQDSLYRKAKAKYVQVLVPESDFLAGRLKTLGEKFGQP